MDSETHISRLLLFFLRILQCSGSVIIIITEILRYIHVVYLIEWETMKRNRFEVLFEYIVMILGFIASAIYILRFKQRWKQPYKCEVFADCLLMNAWMIFGILRLSPQFDGNLLNCSQYELEKRKGCITYISMLALGFFISASYFLTAMVSTWIRAGKDYSEKNKPTNNPTNNPTNSASLNSSKSLNQSESNEIRNSQITNNIPQVITQEREEISLKEFIDHNKHLAHLFNENSEFNRTDGTIIILRKPTPPFLNNGRGPPSHNSSLYDNNFNSRYMSEYSLDSSFSRIYGSIIIPRKCTPSPSETDTNTCSTISKNQTNSTYSENSSQSLSTLSDKTSRSSRYDGSIIIKLAA